jgi:hypothetical protein
MSKYKSYNEYRRAMIGSMGLEQAAGLTHADWQHHEAELAAKDGPEVDDPAQDEYDARDNADQEMSEAYRLGESKF